MAMPNRLAITSPGTYVIGVDYLQDSFRVSVGIDLTSGSATGVSYTLSYALANVLDPTISGWHYYPDVNLGNAQTTTQATQYTTPVTALQLIVASISAGTVYFEVVQSMSPAQ